MALTDEQKKDIGDLLDERIEKVLAGETFTKSLGAAISTAVGGAVKDYGSRFEKKLTKELEPVFETVKGLKTRADEDEATRAKAAEKTPDDAQGGKAGDGKAQSADLASHPLLLELRKGREEDAKKIKKLEDEAKSARADAAKERASKRDAQLRSTTLEELGKHGIKGALAKAALAMFLDDKAVGYEADDADAIVFGKDADNRTPLGQGVADWVKTEAAREFLPPRGARGSGDRAVGSAPQGAGGNELLQQATKGVQDWLSGNLR